MSVQHGPVTRHLLEPRGYPALALDRHPHL